MKTVLHTAALVIGAALYGYFGFWVSGWYVLCVTFGYAIHGVMSKGHDRRILEARADFRGCDLRRERIKGIGERPVPRRPGVEHPDDDNEDRDSSSPNYFAASGHQPTRPSGAISKPPDRWGRGVQPDTERGPAKPPNVTTVVQPPDVETFAYEPPQRNDEGDR